MVIFVLTLFVIALVFRLSRTNKSIHRTNEWDERLKDYEEGDIPVIWTVRSKASLDDD